MKSTKKLLVKSLEKATQDAVGIKKHLLLKLLNTLAPQATEHPVDWITRKTEREINKALEDAIVQALFKSRKKRNKEEKSTSKLHNACSECVPPIKLSKQMQHTSLDNFREEVSKIYDSIKRLLSQEGASVDKLDLLDEHIKSLVSLVKTFIGEKGEKSFPAFAEIFSTIRDKIQSVGGETINSVRNLLNEIEQEFEAYMKSPTDQNAANRAQNIFNKVSELVNTVVTILNAVEKLIQTPQQATEQGVTEGAQGQGGKGGEGVQLRAAEAGWGGEEVY